MVSLDRMVDRLASRARSIGGGGDPDAGESDRGAVPTPSGGGGGDESTSDTDPAPPPTSGRDESGAPSRGTTGGGDVADDPTPQRSRDPDAGEPDRGEVPTRDPGPDRDPAPPPTPDPDVGEEDRGAVPTPPEPDPADTEPPTQRDPDAGEPERGDVPTPDSEATMDEPTADETVTVGDTEVGVSGPGADPSAPDEPFVGQGVEAGGGDLMEQARDFEEQIIEENELVESRDEVRVDVEERDGQRVLVGSLTTPGQRRVDERIRGRTDPLNVPAGGGGGQFFRGEVEVVESDPLNVPAGGGAGEAFRGEPQDTEPTRGGLAGAAPGPVLSDLLDGEGQGETGQQRLAAAAREELESLEAADPIVEEIPGRSPTERRILEKTGISGAGEDLRAARQRLVRDVEGVTGVELPITGAQARRRSRRRQEAFLDEVFGDLDNELPELPEFSPKVMDVPGLPLTEATAEPPQASEFDISDVLDDAPELGAGGLAGAAAVGVAAPEPATTVGGAAVLGGLAVGAVGADVARRRGVFDEGIEVPEEGTLFSEEELAIGESTEFFERRELPLTETFDVLAPEREAPTADLFGPEIPVPDRPPGASAPADLVATTAAQRALGRQRQREREEREDLLTGEDILGPEDVFPEEERLGETRRTLEDIQREFDQGGFNPAREFPTGESTVIGREIIEPREPFAEPEIGTEPVPIEEVDLGPRSFDALGPGVDVGVAPGARVDQAQDQSLDPAAVTAPAVDQGQREDQAQRQRQRQIQEQRQRFEERVTTPTTPAVATPPAFGFEQREPPRVAPPPTPTPPPGEVAELNLPERDKERRSLFDESADEFEKTFLEPIISPGEFLAGDDGLSGDTT